MTQALVIIDLQQGVLAEPGTWDAEGVVARAAELARRARRANVPVIWVQHASDELADGSPAWEFAPGLGRDEAEPVVHKRYPDAFEETTLAETLGDVHHLVVAGAQTDACIRATVQGALVRGYEVTLAADAHTTGEFPPEFTGGEPISARTKINVINCVVEWGSAYPGRRGHAVPAAEILFGT
ncbi:isochorismatase family protein [Propionicicella superfundia]|uniref:isochorismatase family protein n=1 Tax=Propionicicella superfundia TaxID=348582 RepID=UPI000409F20F|nr:isochorismatase family protein [Propionicicella superfundia]